MWFSWFLFEPCLRFYYDIRVFCMEYWMSWMRAFKIHVGFYLVIQIYCNMNMMNNMNNVSDMFDVCSIFGLVLCALWKWFGWGNIKFRAVQIQIKQLTLTKDLGSIHALLILLVSSYTNVSSICTTLSCSLTTIWVDNVSASSNSFSV